MHWGDHTRPYVVTDFERDTAKRLSELGVDLGSTPKRST
jgi:hypothetical protein